MIFPKPNPNADIHSYRAIYATRVYNEHKREYKEFKDERLIIYKNKIIDCYIAKRRNKHMPIGYRDVSSAYYCRNDLKGTVYDRRALFEASRAVSERRIYDRILACCVPVLLDGVNFRKDIALKKLKKATQYSQCFCRPDQARQDSPSATESALKSFWYSEWCFLPSLREAIAERSTTSSFFCSRYCSSRAEKKLLLTNFGKQKLFY